MKKNALIFALTLIILFAFSCRKETIETDDSLLLEFSADTVLFDTVFTTMGSTTKRLKIYNPSNNRVKISSIAVNSGANSQFRINVDGTSGNIHKDVFIDGKDSLFIFAEVTIDPNNNLTEFVVSDKIVFLTNGNIQKVDLVAWGQNAHYYIANKSIGGINLVYLDRDNSDNALDSTWVDDKPYVIYGGYLTIDGNDKLTIEKGVQVHLHNNAGIWVFEGGNIVVNGEKDDEVVFQGTRLEYAWQDRPGQWDRIWINEGTADNVFNHAIIKNGFIGIQAETNPFNAPALFDANTANALRLNSCQIHNNSAVGILATNYKITDTNSVITNSGQYNVLVKGDGDYRFNHTTIANYWAGTERKTPAVLLQNAYTHSTGVTVVSDLSAANFYNCIIDGDQDIEFSSEELSGGTINFLLDNCVLKTTNSTAGANYNNITTNPGNIFVDNILHDYHLNSGSYTGPNINVNVDKDDMPRDPTTPDLGAYEH
ncbi:MAG: hypothetical protein ACPGSL_08720 [Vicingaceae bacterium]